uniref:C-type lectin domain-containing protein n=1 Tax=Lepeophtheirus salmonis TaxID=72036 RepID=A0A0K2TWB1_LEPSM|nr:uncharacterized protein LOC121132330 [Lepeophtheirus salmonis]
MLRDFSYLVVTLLLLNLFSFGNCLNTLFDNIQYQYPYCRKPYVKIGSQCLFFSRPYEPWGITSTWKEAYLNFYDAVALCKIVGGGKLASQVTDYDSAKQHCLYVRGGCAPSLIRKGYDKCYQWSPIDGSELQIPCRRWEVEMRFICEDIK